MAKWPNIANETDLSAAELDPVAVDTSGAEGVEHPYTPPSQYGIEDLTTEYFRVQSENLKLKDEIEALKEALKKNTDILASFLKKISPLIEDELEIDGVLRKTLSKEGISDPFSAEGNTWVFPQHIIEDYLEE